MSEVGEPPVPPRPAEEGDSTGGIIPYKNPPALIGYYLAIFSLLPCFPIGIAALICGIFGLRKVKAHPIVRGTVHAWIAIVLGGVCGIGWLALTIGLLVVDTG